MTDQFLQNINDKTKEVLIAIEPMINEFFLLQSKLNQITEKLTENMNEKLSQNRLEIMEHQIQVQKDIRMTIQNTKL